MGSAGTSPAVTALPRGALWGHSGSPRRPHRDPPPPPPFPPPPLQPPWGGAISACNSRGRRKQTPRCSALTPRPKIATPKGTEIPPSWEGSGGVGALGWEGAPGGKEKSSSSSRLQPGRVWCRQSGLAARRHFRTAPCPPPQRSDPPPTPAVGPHVAPRRGDRCRELRAQRLHRFLTPNPHFPPPTSGAHRRLPAPPGPARRCGSRRCRGCRRRPPLRVCSSSERR